MCFVLLGMRRYLFFVCFLLLQASATYADQLEDAYKEKYGQLLNEIKHLNSVNSMYDEFFKKNDNLESQINQTVIDYRAWRISEREKVDRLLRLYREQEALLRSSLEKFKGLEKDKLTFEQMRQDNESVKNKKNRVEQEILELKIKLLEQRGELPSWWIN